MSSRITEADAYAMLSPEMRQRAERMNNRQPARADIRSTPQGECGAAQAKAGLGQWLSFSLPFPPSVNHYWRHVGAKVLISKEGREYRKRVAAAVLGRVPRAFEGRLEVNIFAHPPDHRRRDLDNMQKALLDALTNAGVYADDSQIDALSITRRDVCNEGYVVVDIREVLAQKGRAA